MKTRSQARSLTIVGVIGTIALALAGCGDNDEAVQSEEENPYGLISPGEIRAASVGDLRPYTFTDADGEYTGFDVELLRDVASRIGIEEVAFSGQDFSAILSAVANGQYDLGVAAIGITEERAETVDFTDGYLAGYLTIMTHDDSGIADEDDIEGVRLGVTQGSLQEQYAVENFEDAELVRFPDNNSAVASLNSRSIDAHFLDYESATLYFDQHDDLMSAAEIPSFDAPAGFAVAPGNDDLREALNGALAEAMEDGTWRDLHEEFFPGSPMPDQYLPSDEQSDSDGDSETDDDESSD